MTEPWEIVDGAIDDAGISVEPLIVGANAVPDGISARWISLGQTLTKDPQGSVDAEPEDFQVSVWLPSNADEARARYREVTDDGLMPIIEQLFKSPHVARVEIVEDGYDGEVTTSSLKSGVIVRNLQVTVRA